ncbi:MAG: bacillithiol transferase BstA [Ignavibacteriae bacterium]|nr:bacillithiol transferase BstA [Ignavibacteria bacterium]MBI3365214.1 bacillithiol transferase BstA [Ignavibacteriota bacterium]
MTDLRYPIGRFQMEPIANDEHRMQCIQHIADAPQKLRAAVRGLSDQQLDTPYRPEGWTVRQVVHHVPDSHLNAYIRFKLAMTETEPAIKTYNETKWAELPEARTAPIEMSLTLLESLHQRWVLFLKTLTLPDLQRQFNHPEHGLMKLEFLLRLYSWHSRHHVAHITSLRERMGWK